MLRLTLIDGTKINVIASHVVLFSPEPDGTLISLSNGLAYKVQESERSIRGYLKKALGLNE